MNACEAILNVSVSAFKSRHCAAASAMTSRARKSAMRPAASCSMGSPAVAGVVEELRSCHGMGAHPVVSDLYQTGLRPAALLTLSGRALCFLGVRAALATAPGCKPGARKATGFDSLALHHHSRCPSASRRSSLAISAASDARAHSCVSFVSMLASLFFLPEHVFANADESRFLFRKAS